jgi:hypothetical protein
MANHQEAHVTPSFSQKLQGGFNKNNFKMQRIIPSTFPLSCGIISPYKTCFDLSRNQQCILLLLIVKVLNFLGTLATFNCSGT